MAYDTVTLSGTYKLIDGTAASGSVTVIPSEAQIVDDTGDVILAGRVKVDLDSTGSFSVELPATDDESLTPTGFGYTLAARLRHTHLPAVSFQLPAAVAEVDISDVTLVDPTAFEPSIDYASQTELDAEAAARTAADTALDARLDTAEAALPLKALAADLTTETNARAAADTALDGRLDTLEGQTLDARLDTLEGQTLDARLTDVEDALEEWLPGTELGYAELTADFTTTNTSISSTTDGPGAGGVIPSFSVGPITGTGRPVEIEFYAPQVRHSVASVFVLGYLIVNGVAQSADGNNGVASSPQTTVGRMLITKRRLVLANGTPYTFKIGICGGAAGTCTIDAATDTRPSLSVVAR